MMRVLTVRLPNAVVAEIEAESRRRQISKSDVVRERLQRAVRKRRLRAVSSAIADLVGSVEGLPKDLSATRKARLRESGYGRERRR